jgi:hypothetical protein
MSQVNGDFNYLTITINYNLTPSLDLTDNTIKILRRRTKTQKRIVHKGIVQNNRNIEDLSRLIDLAGFKRIKKKTPKDKYANLKPFSPDDVFTLNENQMGISSHPEWTNNKYFDCKCKWSKLFSGFNHQ